MTFRFDPASGGTAPIVPLQPASGVSAPTVTSQSTSEQNTADVIGDVMTGGTQDGVSLAYDSVDRTVDVTNTDKGSVAVAAHVALPDPHPQYETAAEVLAQIATHSAAADPHGDRAFATAADAAHVAAADPHTQYVEKAGDTMTGVLQLTAGSAAAPSLRLSADTVGLYRPGTNILGLATAGLGRVEVRANGSVVLPSGQATTTSRVVVQGNSATDRPFMILSSVTAGTNNNGGVTFEREGASNGPTPDNESYGEFRWNGRTSGSSPFTLCSLIGQGGTVGASGAIGEFRIATNDGTSLSTRLTVSSAGMTLASGQVVTPSGSASAPAYSFSSDLGTGLYRIGSSNLGFSVGGTNRVQLSSTGLCVGGGAQTHFGVRADSATLGAAAMLHNRNGTLGSTAALHYVVSTNDLSDNRHSSIIGENVAATSVDIVVAIAAGAPQVEKLRISLARSTFSTPITVTGNPRFASPTVPASAIAAGTAGDFAWDANYLYICTAANTWRRVAHATW